MLRLGLVFTVIPLVLAGGVAHDWSRAAARPCAALTSSTPSMAFTTDPSAATVRIQIVEHAELADLVIADDATTAEPGGCGLPDVASLIRIEAQPRPGQPLVLLTHAADADYRIYVDSTKVSAEQAAALLVSTRGGHARLAAQPVEDLTTGSIRR